MIMTLNLIDVAWLFAWSAASNAVPLFGASYTLLAVAMLYKAGINLPNVLEAIFVTALGASLSKNVMYGLGIFLRAPLSSNRNASLLRRFVVRRSFYVTTFVLAVLPALPLDDYLYLGGGVGGASPLKVNVVALAGKLAKSALEIPLELVGLTFIEGFTRRVGLSFLDLTAMFALLFVMLGYAVIKIDWEKALRRLGLAKRFFGEQE